MAPKVMPWTVPGASQALPGFFVSDDDGMGEVNSKLKCAHKMSSAIAHADMRDCATQDVVLIVLLATTG